MTHRVHLDYASSAPMRNEVRQEITSFVQNDSFDPRRLYDPAIVSRYSIEENRQKVADFVGCLASEVIFTSSASESLATFVYGVIPREEQSFRDDINFDGHFNVIDTPYNSKVIHEIWLRENIDARMLAANDKAQLNIDKLEDFVDESTIGISVPFVHPDTGTLQEVEKIVDIVKSKNENCLVHIDARIACGNITIDFDSLSADAMTIDPVVFGVSSGVAALILKSGLRLSPLLPGSTQERTRRAGMENAIGISGFGKACEITSKRLDDEINTYTGFRQKIVEILKVNGAKIITENSPNLPNIVCAYFDGVAASVIVQELNSKGINIHAGSSCGSEEFEPSLELTSVVGDENIAESAFRISWGWNTTEEDIQDLALAIGKRSVT